MKKAEISAKKDDRALPLLRHGRPEPDPVFRYTGQREVVLSREGRKQARQWGEALRDMAIS